MEQNTSSKTIPGQYQWWRHLFNVDKVKRKVHLFKKPPLPEPSHTTEGPAWSATANETPPKSSNPDHDRGGGQKADPCTPFQDGAKPTLLHFILQHGHLKESEYYKMGFENGKDMGMFTDAVAGIESYFDALIISGEQAKQVFGGEIFTAKKELDDLEKEIEGLEEDLDEKKESSTAWQISNEIKRIREKIDVHLRSKFQDDFVQRYKEVVESYFEEERAQIDALRAERERLKQNLVELVEGAKARMIDLLNNDFKYSAKRQGRRQNQNADDSTQEFSIKEQIEQIRNAYDAAGLALSELSNRILDNLREKQELLFERLVKEEEALKKEPLQIPRRPRLWSLFLAFIVIITGELFVLSHITTRVLKMDPTMVSGIFGDNSLLFRVSVITFVLAYPTALGMIIKFYVSNKKIERGILINRLIRWIGIIGLITIACLAILNANSILKDQLLEGIPNVVSGFIYTLVFFGITTIFSVIAGILYVEFMEGYELFRNARKEPIQRVEDKDTFVVDYEQQIQKKRLELEKLRCNLDEKKSRKYSLQGMANVNLDEWDVKGALEKLKVAACHAFKYGYQRGLDETLKEKEHDPEVLLTILTARRIVQHHLKLFEKDN